MTGMLRMMIVLASLASLAGSAPSSFTHGSGCECPELSPSWVVYPDSARGTPDFYWGDPVQIREVLICDRSVHLFFDAKQSGHKRNVCLVIAEMPFEKRLHHIPFDSVLTDADLEQIEAEDDWGRLMFRERVDKFRELLGERAIDNQRITFKTGWLRQPPKLYPGAPLLVKWRGRRVELVGMVDVYFE